MSTITVDGEVVQISQRTLDVIEAAKAQINDWPEAARSAMLRGYEGEGEPEAEVQAEPVSTPSRKVGRPRKLGWDAAIDALNSTGKGGRAGTPEGRKAASLLVSARKAERKGNLDGWSDRAQAQVASALKLAGQVA